MGFLKMFNIRQNDEKSLATFITSCNDDKVPNAATSIAYHPTQKHIVLIIQSYLNSFINVRIRRSLLAQKKDPLQFGI